MTAAGRTSHISCMARLRDMQNGIWQLVSHVRLGEVILSRAQIQGHPNILHILHKPVKTCCSTRPRTGAGDGHRPNNFRGAKLKDVKKQHEKIRGRCEFANPLELPCLRPALPAFTMVEGNRYFSCCLSPVILLDPCCHVVAEVPVETVKLTENKIT